MSIIGISSGAMQRPDPSQFANRLFAQLDTQQQGYIEKSDLQAAFSLLDKQRGQSGSSDVDDVFSQLDSDSDGKVTKDEFSTAIQNLAEQLDQQLMHTRMAGAQGGGGMPPPPPPADDAGFSKDELSSQLEQIGSSDSKRSELITNIVSNFDQADADGDGKVSFQEAMAYDKASQATSNDAASSGQGGGPSSKGNDDARLMLTIMQLAQAYGGFGGESDQSAGVASLLSAQA
jgi:Ca2+-binding EF-hand superfamily protein